MRPSRSENESSRRRKPSVPSQQASRTQSFTCAADLLRAFEHRAFELGCSFDWLLEEAMQRLLAESSSHEPVALAHDDATEPPPPPDSFQQVRPQPFAQVPLAPITMPMLPQPCPTPPPPPQRSRAAPVAVEPLVLRYGEELLIVDRQPYVVGRSPTMADLVIESGEVSRRHAVIEHTADGWVITDLGSTNGIIIDGEAVRHALLLPGSVMTIGPMTFGVA